jgi:hypothetical protein
MNKRKSYRKNSRKTSKKYKKSKSPLKRRTRKSPVKRTIKRSYRFPNSKEILGVCVLDTQSNYDKIYGSIFPKLEEVNIIRADDELNFCMLNLDINEENIFKCQIKADYDKYEIPDKKYDIIILDGCPIFSYISMFTEENIKKFERSLKDDGYLIISYGSEKIPEEIMTDNKANYIGNFFLDIFFKQYALKAKKVHIHVYRKKSLNYVEEYDPGYYEESYAEEYEPGYYKENLKPEGMRFKFFSK